MVATTDPHGINKAGSPGSLDRQIDSWGFVHGRRDRVRLMIGFGVLGAGVVGLVIAFLLVRFGGENFHKVSDQFYRSDELAPKELKKVIKANDIRTVIRLVGTDDGDAESYKEESSAVIETQATLVVAKMAATRMPYRSELSRVFQALHDSQRPLLVHCRQGSDRTGLVSAIWVHDYMGESLEVAREQLDFVPYGHVAVGEAGAMDRFLDLYQQYTEKHPDEKLSIEQWVKLHYFDHKPGHEIGPWYDGKMYRPAGN